MPRYIRALLMLGLIVGLAAPVQAQTATPTDGPRATPTPALVACNGAEIEPNGIIWGCVIAAGAPVTAQLNPGGDVDGYVAWLYNDRLYRVLVTTATAGLDPVLTLARLNGQTVATAARPAGTTQVSLSVQVDVAAYYVIAVQMQGVITGEYTLALSELPATAIPATPTPTPANTLIPTAIPAATNTPVPTTIGAQWEPNNEWNQAAELQLGQPKAKELQGGEWWALRVKPEVRYQCTAASTQLDPTITVFDNTLTQVAFNDDAQAGSSQAVVKWLNHTDGLAYIQINSTFGSGGYQVTCTVPTDTASTSGGSSAPAATATMPATLTPLATLTPTPTATTPATWRKLSAAATPTPPLTTLSVQIYYDANANQAPDPGEGVAGLPVRALTRAHIAAWGLTDANGQITLAVTGNVERVSVAYLNIGETVRPGETRAITWRIPAVSLPVFLPVAEDAAIAPDLSQLTPTATEVKP